MYILYFIIYFIYIYILFILLHICACNFRQTRRYPRQTINPSVARRFLQIQSKTAALRSLIPSQMPLNPREHLGHSRTIFQREKFAGQFQPSPKDKQKLNFIRRLPPFTRSFVLYCLWCVRELKPSLPQFLRADATYQYTCCLLRGYRMMSFTRWLTNII